MIERVKLKLIITFSMIDMGHINFYLGLKVYQNQENYIIKLLQPAYINKIFNKFHLGKAYAVNTSIKNIALLE